MSERHAFTIDARDARRRLDEFLARQFGGISRMRLRQAVQQGEVTVDGAVVPPGHRLRAGGVVVVELGKLAPTAMTPEPIPIEILYEDDSLAVVNKPAGMLAHPVRHYKHGTLANALAYHFNVGCGSRVASHGLQSAGREDQPASQPRTDAPRPTTHDPRPVVRPGIAHRLDRLTSGLMVVAKTDGALRRLTIDFQNREVEKRYRALVWGVVGSARGWIAAPIGRNPESRPRWWVHPEGRPAETRYRVERRLPGFTLLELEPLTGRTNQLRIHCAWMGHPIAGDPEYGSGQGSRVEGQGSRVKGRGLALAAGGGGAWGASSGRLLPDRLFLHASYLAFRHPATREWVAFESALPPELAGYLRDSQGEKQD